MTHAVSLNWIELHKGQGKALYRQIADQVRDAILTGQLASDTRLPPSRVLAEDLQVSRITVTQAYDQLASEGIVICARGSGTRVMAGSTGAAPTLQRCQAPTPTYINALYGDESNNVAFQPGIPALDAFPHMEWARRLSRAALRQDDALLDYGHAGGYGPLREQVCNYLCQSRGLTCEPDQIIVVTSVRAAIALAASVLVPAQAQVAVEDPGYQVAARVLARRHVVRPVPVDGHGIDVQALAKTDAVLAYLTPAHHWPTGVALSPTRRAALVDWAATRQAWLLEDDYDSEFRFEAQPLRPLYARAPERVIYMGTFSKTFAPSVRVAYLVVPPARVQDFEKAVFERAIEPALHVQAALADMMRGGRFALHIHQMRKLYGARRARLVAAMKDIFDDRLTCHAPPGGLQIIAHLPPHIRASDVSVAAARADLVARDLSGNFAVAPPINGLHLGFAAIPEHQIEPAVRRLRDAIAHLF